MTFLNDLWKKFKSPAPKDWAETHTTVLEEINSPNTENLNPPDVNQYKEKIAKAYQDNESENTQRQNVIENLKALQKLVNQPKEEVPELRFNKIEQHLGDAESHETVRQERWADKIQCPSCSSSNLKRLAQLPPNNVNKHRYRCLACGLEFNDDTGTPMEAGIPNINVWMLCWYLMGCTDSISYIAAKLNLEASTVEMMVRQLQLIFNAQKPLTRFIGFDEWNEQSKELREQLKEDLLKQYEILDANVATVPKVNTEEFRRQQNLRRTLSSNTDPTPPTTTPTFKKRR